MGKNEAMQNVAFLGLGTMGGGMAMRLIGAGLPLRAWNRSPERAEALRQAGATIAASPREAAAGADIVISMVADDTASRAVWKGADGALAGARRGALLIECRTLSPEWIQDLAAAAAEGGCAFLDAPVTGSKPQAAAGELLFLVGGDVEAVERARPVLQPMSRDIMHLGPIGSGARMKLVNNFVCGVQVAALAEALALVEASGLDVEKAMAVLANGAPGSPVVKAVSARMTTRDYRVMFLLSLMRKDLAYAVDEAARHQLPLETAETARDVFQSAIDEGWILGHGRGVREREDAPDHAESQQSGRMKTLRVVAAAILAVWTAAAARPAAQPFREIALTIHDLPASRMQQPIERISASRTTCWRRSNATRRRRSDSSTKAS